MDIAHAAAYKTIQTIHEIGEIDHSGEGNQQKGKNNRRANSHWQKQDESLC